MPSSSLLSIIPSVLSTQSTTLSLKENTTFNDRNFLDRSTEAVISLNRIMKKINNVVTTVPQESTPNPQLSLPTILELSAKPTCAEYFDSHPTPPVSIVTSTFKDHHGWIDLPKVDEPADKENDDTEGDNLNRLAEDLKKSKEENEEVKRKLMEREHDQNDLQSRLKAKSREYDRARAQLEEVKSRANGDEERLNKERRMFAEEKRSLEAMFSARIKEQKLLIQQQQQLPPPLPRQSNPYAQQNQNAPPTLTRQNSNPFQSASVVTSDDIGSRRQEASDPNSHPDEQPAVANNSNIPESLTKKFVPPKRKNAGEAGNNNNNNNNNNRKQSNKKSKKDDNDDEEELPPELEHLDPELVKQITYDILKPDGKNLFDSISGLKAAKTRLHEMIILPLLCPDIFQGLTSPPKGLLLFGPPGTGKTLIGKAIANESKSVFFSISSSSLTSKWIGQGEKMVKTLFEVAAYNSPAIVFIDEVDSILTKRTDGENEASRRMKTEILVQLDGAKAGGNVLIIGATNRPGELDDAARRRFVAKLYIPLPEYEGRVEMITKLLATEGTSHTMTEEDIKKLASKTDGYSGADMATLCRDAANGPLRHFVMKSATEKRDLRENPIRPDELRAIQYRDFKNSLNTCKASVAQTDLGMYEEFDKTFGGLGSKPADTYDDDDDDTDNSIDA
ncbi:hypothetical protein TrVE_jg2444 [Triparma verrucosa]|uniref:AAA+ ATPase domain-containing protein n=1 Tax=Triparma verrucosa TaxID=1606542 RepID=A0A9W7C233_9STRA|nr:hypothetical protein TrVE_jg2444 [Triparma verrucosa]